MFVSMETTVGDDVNDFPFFLKNCRRNHSVTAITKKTVGERQRKERELNLS